MDIFCSVFILEFLCLLDYYNEYSKYSLVGFIFMYFTLDDHCKEVCNIYVLAANVDAIKEHHKASNKFRRELITKLPQAAFVLLSLILQCQTLWSSVQKNVLQLHGGVKKPLLTLSSFYFFSTSQPFSKRQTRYEGLTDSYQDFLGTLLKRLCFFICLFIF